MAIVRGCGHSVALKTRTATYETSLFYMPAPLGVEIKMMPVTTPSTMGPIQHRAGRAGTYAGSRVRIWM